VDAKLLEWSTWSFVDGDWQGNNADGSNAVLLPPSLGELGAEELFAALLPALQGERPEVAEPLCARPGRQLSYSLMLVIRT